MNILIPLCGSGKRFLDAGYDMIKPLIRLNQKYIVSYLIDRLLLTCDERDIYLVINDDVEKYNFTRIIKEKYKTINIVNIHVFTSGACETVLKGINSIDNFRHDKILAIDGDAFYSIDLITKLLPFGNALVYFEDNSDMPIYSYLKVNTEDNLIDIKEKIKISNNANCGAYLFKSVNFAKEVIQDVLNNNTEYKEYFLSLCYNKMLMMGEIIKCIRINKTDFISLGTPKQVREFQDNIMNFLLDLDGTLVYTDTIYQRIWSVILKEYNIDLTNELYLTSISGNSDKSVCDILNIQYTVEISCMKDKLFIEYIDEIKVIDGVQDFIKNIWYMGNNISIVTNCNYNVAKAILEKINILKYIDNIVSADMCIKTKPYPDSYIDAYKYYNNNIRNIIFEDSKAGLLSATSFSPDYLVGVKNDKNKDYINNFGCDKIIDNFTNISLDEIKNQENTDKYNIIKKMIREQFKCEYDITNIIVHKTKMKGGFIADIIAIDIMTPEHIYKCVLKMKNTAENMMTYMSEKLDLFGVESYFYESISTYVNVHTPTFYCNLRDERMNLFGILMKRIEGSEFILNLILNKEDISVTYNLIDEIIMMHTKFMNMNLNEKFINLRRNIDNVFWCRFVKERLPYFVDKWKLIFNPTFITFIKKSVEDYENIQKRLSCGNLTLCHGDFKSPNIFYKKSENKYTPYLMDWQYTIEGKGVQDIIFLIIESFSVDNIEKYCKNILNYYYDNIMKHNPNLSYTKQEYLDDIRDSICCFPLLVAIWFGSAKEEDLIDKEFPYNFIQKFIKITNVMTVV